MSNTIQRDDASPGEVTAVMQRSRLDSYDAKHRAPMTVGNFLRDPTLYAPVHYAPEDES